jgi:predicted RNA methylase
MTAKQGTLEYGEEQGEVECLGVTFPSDSARRDHFRQRLAEFLADPEFRKRPGFPSGSDADIIEMSDPPYYTACPNPFLDEFIASVGTSYDPTVPYSKSPLAIDVSVGKTDPLYKAHGYHTKVPHQAIVPSILHYTNPGDLVLDAFGGSGMTGVAASYCGVAPAAYRQALEAEFKAAGRADPKWGKRAAVINDLSPAATFIAANYITPFDVDRFETASAKLLADLREEIGWMYETTVDGEQAQIDYTVWSEVFTCPECTHEIVFLREALDPVSKSVRERFPCAKCGAELTKDDLDRVFEISADKSSQQLWRRAKYLPVLICYSTANGRQETLVSEKDVELLRQIDRLPLPPEVPTTPFPIETMAHGSRIAPKGFTNIHHFYLPRAAQAMGTMWRLASRETDPRTRKMLLFAVEQAIWSLTLLNRYRPTAFSQFGQYLSGVYYIASQHAECSPWYTLSGKFNRLAAAFRSFQAPEGNVAVSIGSAASLPIVDASVDYIFTDPPFGENIYYADLNFLVEAWHGVTTSPSNEAIVDSFKDKDLPWYQNIMEACFSEYFRVLKPGRWMTVVFSNSKASVWNSIQVALQQAGFVVAEVTALDKTQGSYRQVTSANAVKQDLVVSCYKPNGGLEDRFEERGLTDDTPWDFVQTHLKNLAVWKRGKSGEIEVIAERDPRRIFDRMVAWFVRHNTPVPLSSAEFQAELMNRFMERDGMMFLPHQLNEYDRVRLSAGGTVQRDLFVDDERTAIDWLSDFLKSRPSTYQEVHPEFTQKTGSTWRKHEERPELAALLDQNFLKYDGDGDVPAQIHTYLSSNWKEMRSLKKNNPVLIEKARNRWYVPDPNKQQDVEKRREKALLREFEHYREHKGRKLKAVRLEVMRVGFKNAWAAKDYGTIVEVAKKVPEDAWQEDERLLMYHSMAQTRLEAGGP